MKEKLKRLIIDLRMQRANLKTTLDNLHEIIDNEQINELLDGIKEIDELIKKLENGLK